RLLGEFEHTGAGEDSIELSFGITITDTDGDSVSATRTATVIDDVPTARADTDSLVDNDTSVTGNVITGASEAGTGAADTQGADGAVISGFTSVNNAQAGAGVVGGAALVGEFGTLTLTAAGTYVYTQTAGAEATGTDVFEYTLTDGDGDTSTATLSISLDGGVTVTVPGADDDGTTVLEAGLPAGTGELLDEIAGNDNSETTSGTITFTASDTPVTISVGGQTIVFEGTSESDLTVDGAFGELTLDVSDIANGNIDYSYTLSDNIDHDDAVADSDTFAVVVTDEDGDFANGSLVIAITDDGPKAVADSQTINASATEATGNVLTNDVAGADDESTTVVGVAAGNTDADLDNAATVGDGTTTGTGIAGTNGTLYMASTGAYTFVPNEGAENFTETFTYTIKDSDGTLSNTTVAITVSDGVTVTVPGAQDDGTTVLEAGLPAGTGELLDEIAGNDNSETTSGTITFTASDTPVTISVGGQTIVLDGAAQGDLTVDGAFGELTLDVSDIANGNIDYSYTLGDNIDHDDVVADSDTFAVVVTDEDGDFANGSLVIAITDDGPKAVADTESVTEGESVTGDVLANDIAGADNESTTVIGVRAADPDGDGPSPADTTTEVTTGVATKIFGQFGSITLGANGGYTYEANANTVPPGAQDVFVYSIEDSDGTRSTTTLTINHSESGLQLDVGDGNIESDDTTLGDFDTQATQLEDSNGTAIAASTYALKDADPDGTITLQQDGDDIGVVSINSSTGVVTFEQSATFSHALNSDLKENALTVTVIGTETSTGNTAEGNVVIDIVDAGVSAVNDEASANEPGTELAKDNLVLIIDLSGSMAWDDEGNEPDEAGFDGTSRLDLAKAAIADLFATGAVNAVNIVTFASGAQSLNSGEWYTDLDAALTAVNALTASGSTDYDAALEQVVSTLDGETYPETDGATKAIFLTDGEPNQDNGTDSDGIDETDTNNSGFGGLGEESYWIEFLEDNGFDDAYAIGFGGIDSDDVSELEPIAVDVGEEDADTYDGNTDANDDHVIINSSPSVGLLQTVDPVPAQGNVLDNDTGVDAPLSLASVSYGVESHDFETDGDTATFSLMNGDGEYGTVEIDSDGEYRFLVTEEVAVLETAVINYVAQDGDGDTDGATLTLKAAPRAEVDSIVSASGSLNEEGATSQSFTVSLVSAPLAAQTFAIGSTALASGDVTAVVTGAGVSYDSVAGTVVVEAGVTDFTVTLTAVDDIDIEGTEQSTLTVGEGSVDFSIEDNDSYTIINATAADDALVGLAARELFTWELADVVDTSGSSVVTNLADIVGELDSTDDGGSDTEQAESAQFTVGAGESVNVTFTAAVENLDEDTSGGNRSEFQWRVETSDGSGVTSWQVYDNDSAGVSGGDVTLNLGVQLDDAGTYQLAFQTTEGTHADITGITLTTGTPVNTDTITDYDAELDALDIGDLLGGGAELSLNFDGGDAQVVVTNAGGENVDQVINLSGVGESALEAALGLDATADANSIISAMLDQGKIVTDA
ncbi:MAG: VWA domain-containing protein, partial [Halioglobus sp.]